MPLTDPNQFQWMEIFYSKPSMQHCHLLQKLPSGDFAAPSTDNRLVDASHVRPGFRVLRCQAAPMEFIMQDHKGKIRDDNHGHNYKIDDATPGRYVVEAGVRRVGDPDPSECFQAVIRPADRFIHLSFQADLWEKCFISFQKPGGDWTPAPGEQMTEMARPGQEGRHFEIIIEAKSLVFAFNDGKDVWDANKGTNYKVATCGRYAIVDGTPTYVSPTERDLEENPTGKPAFKPAPKPAVKPAAIAAVDAAKAVTSA